MEIIENNYKGGNWLVRCKHCDSLLRYEKKDVITYESHFFCLHYINCPCCGHDVDVANW
jgi:hypothetical protein